MILPDVNVLVNAYIDDSEFHEPARAWLDETLDAGLGIALADFAVSGMLRVTTNRRIFHRPATPRAAVEFVDSLLRNPNVHPVAAGDRHWPIFGRLLIESQATGPLVSDAHIAALALEHECSVATSDRDFARFPGVEWFDPLDQAKA